jgi:hypothetical protein
VKVHLVRAAPSLILSIAALFVALGAGDFDQVASACDSTEIAADGQELDVFFGTCIRRPGRSVRPRPHG